MSGRSVGKVSVRLGSVSEVNAATIVDFLRRIHPTKTADCVGCDLGVSPDTVRKWLDGTAAPSLRMFGRMVNVHGIELLAAVFPSLECIRDAALTERTAAIHARIKACRDELSRLP